MEKSYYNVIETLLLIYTVENGKLKIYLKQKQADPYKGNWILPSEFLTTNKTIEENAKDIFAKVSTLNAKIFQSETFSNLDRDPNGRIIALTNVAIVGQNAIKKESKLKAFDIYDLPQMGYDHKYIVEVVSNKIKNKIENNFDDVLLDLFPKEFTLPELQTFFENISGKNIDRRNFHKKFVSQKLVIDTGKKQTQKSGRPGTLYKFNIREMKGKRI
jgi:8-oxo-dGTP diphosphatase